MYSLRGATTLNITAFRIMTLNITAFRIMTLNIMTFSIIINKL